MAHLVHTGHALKRDCAKGAVLFEALMRKLLFKSPDPRSRRHHCMLVFFALVTASMLAIAQPLSSPNQQFPDVLAVKVKMHGAALFDFDVTVSSPYDTAKRYADGFCVTGPDGRVYGERKLLHDHANEQPFTRDLHGVTIPPGVRHVTVQAKDQKYGYGGKAAAVSLPGP
jgi:hypothetical protein